MNKLDRVLDILRKAKAELEKAAPPIKKGIPNVTDWDHNQGPMPEDHPHRPKVVEHIANLSRSSTPGHKNEARRLYENYIAGTPGTYTKGPKGTGQA